ncbi:MAG: hypothetical protein MUE41_04270 [Gemmatimonadaceae bacterium]|jgi:hypothetical protein|nr:hypothetical protein [Gemmatimonadaceae bacterium]
MSRGKAFVSNAAVEWPLGQTAAWRLSGFWIRASQTRIEYDPLTRNAPSRTYTTDVLAVGPDFDLGVQPTSNVRLSFSVGGGLAPLLRSGPERTAGLLGWFALHASVRRAFIGVHAIEAFGARKAGGDEQYYPVTAGWTF